MLTAKRLGQTGLTGSAGRTGRETGRAWPEQTRPGFVYRFAGKIGHILAQRRRHHSEELLRAVYRPRGSFSIN